MAYGQQSHRVAVVERTLQQRVEVQRLGERQYRRVHGAQMRPNACTGNDAVAKPGAYAVADDGEVERTMGTTGVTLVQQHFAARLLQCADGSAKVKTRVSGAGGVLQQVRERGPADSERMQARAQVRVAQVHSFDTVGPAGHDTRDAAAERQRGIGEVHAT